MTPWPPLGCDPTGFFWSATPTPIFEIFLMIRVSFLVDGFNLYHSVRNAQKDLGKSTKWLDIRALCTSYLSTIATSIGKWTELGDIFYFSALARHLEAKSPDVTKRHKAYLSCLKDTGIVVELRAHSKITSAFPPSEKITFLLHDAISGWH